MTAKGSHFLERVRGLETPTFCLGNGNPLVANASTLLSKLEPSTSTQHSAGLLRDPITGRLPPRLNLDAGEDSPVILDLAVRLQNIYWLPVGIG